MDFLLLVALLELSLDVAAGLLSVLELVAEPPELAPPLVLAYRSPYHPPPLS